MFHVNAFDKFLKNNFGLIVILILVVATLCFIIFKAVDTNNEKQSIDYKTGYSNGFKEINLTRYNAAKQIIADYPTTILLPPNVAYADGYINGYEDGLSNQANVIIGYVPSNK